jgi:hypothetical protein
MLCESGFNGGKGYTPEQVGKMTLDQIWFCLCDIELLKSKVGERTKKMEPSNIVGRAKDEPGVIRGRAEDGTPIKGRIRGKSLARELMEEAEKKEDLRRRRARREKRRKRNQN